MNALNRWCNRYVMKSFNGFVRDLGDLCRGLKFEFELKSQTSDDVDFCVNGIPFTLTWSTGTKERDGRKVPIVLFQLHEWNLSYGGRMNPPEWIDRQIGENESVFVLAGEVLTWVINSTVSGYLESKAYDAVPEPEEW